MQDIDIMDRSFEIYHNSEGRRNLFQSSFEGEDIPEGKGEDKPKGGKTKPTRTPIDPEKLSATLSTLASTAGSVAGTVQAFQDPNKSTSRKAKKETKRSLVQVCGRKPLFSKAKNGSTESFPIYGATVTESKFKSSKNALAYIEEVFPISPRFASAIVKISGYFLFI